MLKQLVQVRLSITRTCQLAVLSRPAYYKRPMPASERDAEVIDVLDALHCGGQFRTLNVMDEVNPNVWRSKFTSIPLFA